MSHLTIELHVEGRPVVFVGSGPEISAKIARVAAAGARVTVAAAEHDGAVRALADAGAIRLGAWPLDDADVDGAFAIFVSPDEPVIAARLFERASREGRLLCTVDRPETSTFTNVAVAEVSGLRVTVGTAGASPGLARRVREDLTSLLSDPRLGRFVDLLREARARLPRGRRAAAMGAAVQGFSISGALRFPAWFERGESSPHKPT